MYRLRHSGILFWLAALNLTGLITVNPFQTRWIEKALKVFGTFLRVVRCIHRAGGERLALSLFQQRWGAVCQMCYLTLCRSDIRYRQDHLCVKVNWETLFASVTRQNPTTLVRCRDGRDDRHFRLDHLLQHGLQKKKEHLVRHTSLHWPPIYLVSNPSSSKQERKWQNHDTSDTTHKVDLFTVEQHRAVNKMQVVARQCFTRNNTFWDWNDGSLARRWKQINWAIPRPELSEKPAGSDSVQA